MTGVYIHLFHGRVSPDVELQDWGEEGPTLGPLDYFHQTYMCDPKFGAEDSKIEGHFDTLEDLLYYDGMLYGDFSITTLDRVRDSQPVQIDPELARCPPLAEMQCQHCRTVQIRICDGKSMECIKDGCNSRYFNQLNMPRKHNEREATDHQGS